MQEDLGRVSPRENGLSQLLFDCARWLDEIAQAEVNREAGERIARPALMRILPYLDFRGIRPTELARRVDVSKQAISQSLTELEMRGLVEYVEDPEDGRSRQVRLTPEGAAAFQQGIAVLEFLENELARRVDRDGLKTTIETLRAVHSVLQVWQSQGAPHRNLKTAGKAALQKIQKLRPRSRR